MEDLAEFGLQLGSNMSSFDNFCATNTEFDNNLSDNNGRPSSVLSIGSWTFSPISDTVSDGHTQDELDSSEQVIKHEATNQQQAIMASQPISNSVTSEPLSSTILQGNHERGNQMFGNVHPNAVTYHHSVNIHNYVGNYCIGQQTNWKPGFVYQMPSPFPCYQENYDYHQPQRAPMAEHHDAQSLVNTASVEFTRCSTPEYLMALNSLHQMDSPPRPNHSAAINMNYTCSSFNESLQNRSTTQPMQDSGYSSDLSESPIIQFQDGNLKLRHSRLTSTPQPPPVVRLTSLPALNKENMPVIPQQFPTHRSLNNQQSYNPPSVLAQHASNVVSKVMLPVQKKVKQEEQQFANMADYQKAKRSAAQKRKVSSTASTVDESTGKRRRHNEPLSDRATQVMTDWYLSNSANPYPSKAVKEELARNGGISLAQVKSWFANKRNRSNNTRPKKQKQEMEERLMEICHQLARDACKPDKDNAYYIQQLASIMHK